MYDRSKRFAVLSATRICLGITFVLFAGVAERGALPQTQKTTQTGKPKESAASLDDTIDFIVGKLNGSQAAWTIHEDKAVSTSTQTYEVLRDGASLVLKEHQRLVHLETDAAVTQDTTWTINLRDLATKTCTVAQIRGEPVAVYLVLNFATPQSQQLTDPQGKTTASTLNEIMITIENRTIAERLLKAFQHAGALAGAKKEVF